MSNTVILLFFCLPLIAGGLVQTVRPGMKGLRLLLSFSGAFLLGVAVLHMLPELYAGGGEAMGIWLLAGFLLQVVLEYFSHGIEHGHVHVAPGKAVPLMTMASLCLHSFVEGMPFADPEVATDLPFLAGVLLHKMPMAVALATVVQRSGLSSGKGWALLVVFSVSAPLGILAGGSIGPGFQEEVLRNALGIAIGMLLHISTTIIFESSPEHRFNAARFVAVLIGSALAVLMVH